LIDGKSPTNGVRPKHALDAITPVVEARLAELRAHADLSKAAGGALQEVEART
jgi:hypothetical protein